MSKFDAEAIYRRVIERHADAIRRGDDYLLLDLLNLIVANADEMPEDIKQRIRAGLAAYQRGDVSTLDRALGLRKSPIQRRKRRLKAHVIAKVNDERRRLAKFRMRGEDPLHNVADELGLSVSKVRRIYYDEDT